MITIIVGIVCLFSGFFLGILIAGRNHDNDE